MTSSNGNIFRVTGPLCREFTGPGEFPTQRPVTRSFDVFFDLCLNKRLSKQPWGWWFETLSWSLWRQCNAIDSSHQGVEYAIKMGRSGLCAIVVNISVHCRKKRMSKGVYRYRTLDPVVKIEMNKTKTTICQTLPEFIHGLIRGLSLGLSLTHTHTLTHFHSDLAEGQIERKINRNGRGV